MKNIFKLFIFITFLLMSSTVNAAGWTSKTKIIGLYALDSNRMLVLLEKFSNPDGCAISNASDKNSHLIFDPINKAFLSIILTAYSSDKNVEVYVNGCTGVWGGTSYANIGHIRTR